MQIRVANRQDEPLIRAITNQIYSEFNQPELELTGKDSDLSNIEAYYFWHDGICIVAEEDGQIIGYAGARKGVNERELQLRRLMVIAPLRKRGVASALLETVRYFANNLEYVELTYDARSLGGITPTNCPWFKQAADGIWRMRLTSEQSCTR